MTDSLDKFKDVDLEKLIWDKLIKDTKEKMDEDMVKILYDNLWDLYDGEESKDT